MKNKTRIATSSHIPFLLVITLSLLSIVLAVAMLRENSSRMNEEATMFAYRTKITALMDIHLGILADEAVILEDSEDIKLKGMKL